MKVGIALTEWALFGFGTAAGLFVAAAADVVVVRLRRWILGNPEIRSHFSPKGGCKSAVIAELASARREILVQAYSFTCPEIADALIAAAARGVVVSILLDRTNETESYSELGDLSGHGIEVLVDAHHAIAHNKVMIVDRRTVITGSFNFTRQAEHENAENLLILRDHLDLAVRYRENFHAHKEHSRAAEARTGFKLPTPHRRAA